jgi:ammonia channel protein AmtB
VFVPACTHSVNPSALCIFIALWHIVVYCPLAHMVWYPTGLIKVFGVLDFAGETQHTCLQMSDAVLASRRPCPGAL